MGLGDKRQCRRCSHPFWVHNGNHIKGHTTICRKEMGRKLRCACLRFVEIQDDSSDPKKVKA
jgi:hypothetical protein